MTTEVQEYSSTEAALSDYENRFKGVIFEVDKKEGMIAAKAGRKELRDVRLELERTRVQIKAPALKRIQLIDSEARRITTIIESLEDPIDEQIKAEDRRKEDERLAAIKAEQDRLQAEQDALRAEREAKIAEEQAARERELAAEKAEIQRQKAELDRANAARIEAEMQSRLKIEEEERQARLARDEADRQARIAREAEDAKQRVIEEEARKVRQAEEDRLRVERETIEAEKRRIDEAARQQREEKEAAERAARESEELKAREIREAEEERQRLVRLDEENRLAAEREAQRQADFERARLVMDLKDGHKALQDWYDRYGDIAQFKTVSLPIKKFLEAVAKKRLERAEAVQ